MNQLPKAEARVSGGPVFSSADGDRREGQATPSQPQDAPECSGLGLCGKGIDRALGLVRECRVLAARLRFESALLRLQREHPEESP